MKKIELLNAAETLLQTKGLSMENFYSINCNPEVTVQGRYDVNIITAIGHEKFGINEAGHIGAILESDEISVRIVLL